MALKQRREHVVRDLDEQRYHRMTSMVYRVARAVEAVLSTERLYLMGLGSQPIGCPGRVTGESPTRVIRAGEGP